MNRIRQLPAPRVIPQLQITGRRDEDHIAKDTRSGVSSGAAYGNDYGVGKIIGIKGQQRHQRQACRCFSGACNQ